MLEVESWVYAGTIYTSNAEKDSVRCLDVINIMIVS